jgi:restriction system protein
MGNRDGSALVDLLEITAKVPWWLGTSLAAGAYLVLHHYATADLGFTFAFGTEPESTRQQLGKMFAQLMQYLVPLALGLGAILSLMRQYRRQRPVKARTSLAKRTLGQMSWQDFELATAEAFRGQGYAVELQGGGSADGGIDLILKRDNERYLVQCKHWRANNVGVPIIRELYGVMAAEGIAGGFVVTSGGFTRQARDFASGREIELIDGKQLMGMLRKLR